MKYAIVGVKLPGSRRAFGARAYSEDEDDFRSVLDDLTQHWSEEGAELVVNAPGFSPLRTPTDASVFLEQAPSLYVALEAGLDGRISMYEQTAMFDITFRSRNSASVVVETTPWASAKVAGHVVVPRAEVLASLQVAIECVEVDLANSRVVPPVKAWMLAWRNGNPV